MKKLILIFFIIAMAGIAQAEEYTYNGGAWEIFENSGYEEIMLQHASQKDEQFMMQEPVGTHVFEFAKGAFIEDIRLIEAKNPVEITANLPYVEYDAQWNTVYVDRECPENSRDAFIDPWNPSYDENTSVRIDFYPLEIVDCEKGIFKLYQSMVIDISFEESSMDVRLAGELIPGKAVTYVAEFSKTPNGDIFVEGPEGLIGFFYANSIETSITFIAPEGEIHEYWFNYFEGDTLIATAFAKEDLSWGYFDFRVLESDNPAIFPLAVEIQNTKEEVIQINLEIGSLNISGEPQTERNYTVEAGPGKRVYYIDFEATVEESANDIGIIASYKGVKLAQIHNSWVRSTKEETEGGLKPPKSEIAEEVMKAYLDEDYKAPKSTDIGSSDGWDLSKSNILGIIIAIALFAVFGYFAIKYLKKE